MDQTMSDQAIRTIGIIGAGQMGNGIAHVAAVAGFEVRLHDLAEDRIKAALATIDGNMARQVARARSATRSADAMAKITAAPKLEGLADCDLVIEAATESEESSARSSPPSASTSSPTRSWPPTPPRSRSRGLPRDRPARALHRHPFHEPGAADAARRADSRHRHRRPDLRARQEFVGKLHKTVSVSEDFPAFIVNRILLPMINEAVYTLYEGVGSVEAIDTAMKLGANHPMGPLQLADFIGLDTCLSVMQVLHDGLADSKYRPCPLLVKYVEAGWLGRKTKRGFYDYRGEKPVPTR
jgi:3-hydroxybutyryl-CoA dehydrogenase